MSASNTYSKQPERKQAPEITSPVCSNAGEHAMPPPSQGPTQRSRASQKIISRARWFGIYFLHGAGGERWIYPKQEASCQPVPIRAGSTLRSRRNPQRTGEGAAGLLQKPWQEELLWVEPMLFNPLSGRSKSRHSDSPITETTPTYSFTAQLPSVPVNQVGISTLGQWTTFALKLRSLMMEKLFLSFLHLFCKSKSKNLFG